MQGPAIASAKRKGLRVECADGNPQAPCAGSADAFHAIDLKDKEGMEHLARAIAAKRGLHAVFTAGTDFSATVAWVAERLGLPGIPYEVALDCSDKQRMRTRLAEAGIASPRFACVGSSCSEPPSGLNFPLVVKPVDNMGARGCKLSRCPAELEEATREAIRYSRTGKAIIESYMEGPEFSIDSLVYDGKIEICGFADRIIRFPPHFVEMGHSIPSAIDAEGERLVLECFKKAVKALGISSGAAKGDMKLVGQGSSRVAMVGEIAARLSGGYMSGWTYPLSSGVDLTGAAIDIALGEKPRGLTPSKSWYSAERAFISIPGRLAEHLWLDNARKEAGVEEVFVRCEEGDMLDFPRNNVEKCGNIIAAASSPEEAALLAEDAARSALPRLEASNPETEAFLALAETCPEFPPNAFALGPSAMQAIMAMPEKTQGRGSIELSIMPCPSALEDSAVDHHGRSVAATIEALERSFGAVFGFQGRIVLGKAFWRALLRGGLQACVYALDTARRES